MLISLGISYIFQIGHIFRVLLKSNSRFIL